MTFMVKNCWEDRVDRDVQSPGAQRCLTKPPSLPHVLAIRSTHFHPHPPTVNNAVMSQLILKPSLSSPRTPCTHSFKPRDLFFLLVKIFVWSNNSDAEATNTPTHSKAACHSRTTGYLHISKVYMDDFRRIFWFMKGGWHFLDTPKTTP